MYQRMYLGVDVDGRAVAADHDLIEAGSCWCRPIEGYGGSCGWMLTRIVVAADLCEHESNVMDAFW